MRSSRCAAPLFLIYVLIVCVSLKTASKSASARKGCRTDLKLKILQLSGKLFIVLTLMQEARTPAVEYVNLWPFIVSMIFAHHYFSGWLIFLWETGTMVPWNSVQC